MNEERSGQRAKRPRNAAQTDSVAPVTPWKGTQSQKFEYLYWRLLRPLLLSLSGGCSAAPPGRRLRRPRRPGARLSSPPLPTRFLRCSGDLEATGSDVRNGREGEATETAARAQATHLRVRPIDWDPAHPKPGTRWRRCTWSRRKQSEKRKFLHFSRCIYQKYTKPF